VSPRLRRLAADYAGLVKAFGDSPYVTIRPLGPMPPERYQVTLSIPGLALTHDNNLMRQYQHDFEISLPAGYPREQPYVVPLSPAFHPNIAAHVCIADFWSPSQSLVDTVIQIADMVQYQLYNVRSPLNAVAARWVEDNYHQVPIGNAQIRVAETTESSLTGFGGPQQ
jgi:ubiquitin-protein ligase